MFDGITDLFNTLSDFFISIESLFDVFPLPVQTLLIGLISLLVVLAVIRVIP